MSQSISDLIGRVEKAEGPSRVLDFELHIALVEDRPWPARDLRGRVTNPHSRMSDYLETYRQVIDSDDQDFDFARYTASLDAALALCIRIVGEVEASAMLCNAADHALRSTQRETKIVGLSFEVVRHMLSALLRSKADSHV